MSKPVTCRGLDVASEMPTARQVRAWKEENATESTNGLWLTVSAHPRSRSLAASDVRRPTPDELPGLQVRLPANEPKQAVSAQNSYIVPVSTRGCVLVGTMRAKNRRSTRPRHLERSITRPVTSTCPLRHKRKGGTKSTKNGDSAERCVERG